MNHQASTWGAGLLALALLAPAAGAVELGKPDTLSYKTAQYDFDVPEAGFHRLVFGGKKKPGYVNSSLDGDVFYAGAPADSTLAWLDKGRHRLVADFNGDAGKYGDYQMSFAPVPADTPADSTLCVREKGREDMVFMKGETLSLDIRRRADAAKTYTVEILPQRPEGGYVPWRRRIELSANQPCAQATVNYPCSQEGAFEYRLLDASGKTAFGPWAFVVVDPAPAPTTKGEPKLELVDKVDCGAEDDGAHAFRENGQSHVVQGPACRYRVGGPTGAHQIGYIKDAIRPGWLREAKPGERAEPNMDFFWGFDWFAYSLAVKHPGKPHLLRVKVPADMERKIVVTAIDPYTRCVNTAVLRPRPSAAADPVATFELVVWPNGPWLDALVTNANFNATEGKLDTRGAVAAFELYEAPEGLPALAEAAGGWDSGREFAEFIEQRDLGAERCAMAKWWDGSEMPPQTLRHNFEWQHGGYDWKALSDAWGRWMNYSGHLGDNTVVYGAHTYLMGMMQSPHLPVGKDVYRGGWKYRPVDRYHRDVLKLAILLAAKNRAKLVADIQGWSSDYTPVCVLELDKEGKHGPDGLFLTTLDGKQGLGFGAGNVLNPAHPLARKFIVALYSELAAKYGKFPGFGGLKLRQFGFNSLAGWFYDENCGYDDFTVGLFTQETGVKVPTGTLAERHDWLKANAWGKWVAWRCAKVTSLVEELAAAVKQAAPQARLYCVGLGDTKVSGEDNPNGLSSKALRGNPALGFDKWVSIGGKGQEMPGLDMICLAKLDVRPGVPRINLSNLLPPYNQIGYLGDLVTGGGASVGNAPFDIEPAAKALAAGNVDIFQMNASWSPATLTPNRREFVRAWRAIPRLDYRKLDAKGAVVCWTAKRGDELIVELVNQSPWPQTVELTFAGTPSACRDLVDGTSLAYPKAKVTVKPFMPRVLAAPGASGVAGLVPVADPAQVARLRGWVENLERIAQEAGARKHRFANVGPEFALHKLSDKDDGEWRRCDLEATATECFTPALAAWRANDYCTLEQELERLQNLFGWWYEVYGWPEGDYRHVPAEGDYDSPAKLAKRNLAPGAELQAKVDGMPGETLLASDGKLAFDFDNAFPQSVDLKAYMLSGGGRGPVAVLVDGVERGTLGTAAGKAAFGRFALAEPLSLTKSGVHHIELRAPAGQTLVVQALDFQAAPFTLLKKWRGAGPFFRGNAHKGWASDIGMTTPLPPEMEAGFDAARVYAKMGLDSQDVSWKEIDLGADKYVQLLERFYPHDLQREDYSALAYLTLWAHSPERREARLQHTGEFHYRIWLNGALVVPDGRGWRWGGFEAGTPVTLEKGWNRLLVKTAPGSAGWTFNAALSDPGDLEFSATPPVGAPAQAMK